MKIRQVIFLTQLSLLFVLIFIFFIFLFFLFFIFDTNEREPSLQGDTYNQPPAETARGDGTREGPTRSTNNNLEPQPPHPSETQDQCTSKPSRGPTNFHRGRLLTITEKRSLRHQTASNFPSSLSWAYLNLIEVESHLASLSWTQYFETRLNQSVGEG
jgi:hypothetical protein